MPLSHGSTSHGLTSAQVSEKRRTFGPNEIAQNDGPSAWRLLASQLRGAMVWLLIGAGALSVLVGHTADATAIGVILVLNAAVGFFQEHRAGRAIAALRRLSAPRARVIRDGALTVIGAVDLVPEDVVVLEAGDLVPADAVVLDAHRLTTNEAALTGESLPVDKHVTPAAPDVPLAERSDCVFMGTSVAGGKGVVRVTATGMATELGKVAGLLSERHEESTPLQVQLSRLGRVLLFLCLGVVALVAAVRLLRGEASIDVLLGAVSLAVAAVPEGLAAIVTIALAVGVQRMASRNVLVRRLAAVETLGCATVVCTDKTGTLTTGTMVVREVWARERKGLLEAAAACCDADLATRSGDTTELALLEAAAAEGIFRDTIEKDRPRVSETPFDSDRKRMSILRADGILYVKGAVDLLLPLCTSGVAGALAAHEGMAGRGMRVLGVARGHGRDERDLELVGLLGLADPPRPEAIAALREARGAGIRTVMITGDHPITAMAIAREMGLVQDDEDPSALVHARATPAQKLEIVRRWKARGDVVAMTGDGVNDAPALREAHIGVAMGKTGTEVAKEASAMILTDDNFASIVAAVREGRGVFENIRKAIVYLMSGNTGEMLVMLGAALAALPIPLLPLQILWINLVTDGLPALALVADPTDRDALVRPPRSPREPILARSQWVNICASGLLIATVVLSTFAVALRTRPLAEARSLAFTVLVVAESLRAFAARSDRRLLWELGVGSNLRLLLVAVVTILLQISLSYVPEAQRLLGFVPLSPGGLLFVGGVALIPVSILELAKLVPRLRRSGAASSVHGSMPWSSL